MLPALHSIGLGQLVNLHLESPSSQTTIPEASSRSRFSGGGRSPPGAKSKGSRANNSRLGYPQPLMTLSHKWLGICDAPNGKAQRKKKTIRLESLRTLLPG